MKSPHSEDEDAFLHSLGNFLLATDKKKRCNFEDPIADQIKRDINEIINTVIQQLPDVNPKFRGKLVPMGSSHEDLKVGDPVEFDFMFEMDYLGEEGDLVYIPAEVGFADVKILNKYKAKWPEIDHYIKDIGRRHVLDPRALQEEFRQAVDDVMKSITLPEYWSHGGNRHPSFSGHRKHGPATLYQFEWNSPEGNKHLKVSLDITLAIKVHNSISLGVFQLNGLDRFPASNKWLVKLRDLLFRGGNIHIIPLYSKELVVKGKFDRKYSFGELLVH